MSSWERGFGAGADDGANVASDECGSVGDSVADDIFWGAGSATRIGETGSDFGLLAFGVGWCALSSLSFSCTTGGTSGELVAELSGAADGLAAV